MILDLFPIAAGLVLLWIGHAGIKLIDRVIGPKPRAAQLEPRPRDPSKRRG